MFKELKITDFRGITDLQLNDLRQVNLLVGKNNSGKTTVLESLYVMINPTSLELFVRTNAWRGIEKLTDRFWRVMFRDQDVTRTIRIDAEFNNNGERRQLFLKPITSPIPAPSADTTAKNPTVSVQEAGSQSSVAVNGLKAVVNITSGQDKHEFEVSVYFEDVSVRTKRPPDYTETRQGIFLNPSSMMLGISERMDRLIVSKNSARVIAVMREIEPKLLSIALGADNTVLCDIGSEWMLPLDAMGGGMKKLLAIVLAMHDTSKKGGTILIDEIENGLYPISQRVLWRTIFEAARAFGVQVVATTHSLDCVRAFSESYSPSLHELDELRLYRIEREQDRFKSVKFSHDTLQTALDSGWEIR